MSSSLPISDETSKLSDFKNLLKSRADSYKWNIRNLEALWNPVYYHMIRDDVEKLGTKEPTAHSQSEESFIFLSPQDAICLPKTKNKPQKEEDPSYLFKGKALPVEPNTIMTRMRLKALQGSANLNQQESPNTTHNQPESGESDDEGDIPTASRDDQESSLSVSISRASDQTVSGSDASGYPDITIYKMKGAKMQIPSPDNIIGQATYRRLAGVEVTSCYPLAFIELKKAVARWSRRLPEEEQSERFQDSLEFLMTLAQQQLVKYANIVFTHPKYTSLRKLPVLAAAGPFWSWTIIHRHKVPLWDFNRGLVRGGEVHERVYLNYTESFPEPVEVDTEESRVELKKFVDEVNDLAGIDFKANHLL